MNLEEIENNRSIPKTVIIHFLMWLLYLAMQFVWRFDSYTIYDITVATIQVTTWAIIFYIVRLYLFPKYLWKNHWKLALAFILIYPVFLKITILYSDYLIGLSGEDGPTIVPVKTHMRRSFFWLFNMSFVAFGFTYYDELGKEKQKALIEEQKRLLIESELQATQLKLKNAELENLKAQFNPHFLFNSLWYIYTLVQDTGDKKATKAVELLSDMMRYSMQNRQVNEFVPLENELNYAYNYIELQRLRSPMIKLDYQVNGNVIGVKILPLVMISFIENACKHGKLNEEDNPLVFHITVEDKHKIIIFVKNKISLLGKERSSGIGLENVKNRLKTAYGNNFTLDITNDGIIYTSSLLIKP
jgi:sensor histidine kinase YesM